MKVSTLSGQPFIDKLERDIPTWILGADEKTAQANLIRRTLDPGAPKYHDMGRSLALWSWQFRPVDPDTIRFLAGTTDIESHLPDPVRKIFNRTKGCFPASDSLEGLGQLLAEEQAKALRLILPALGNPDTGFHLLGSVWDSLLRLGRKDIPMAALETFPWPEDLLAVRDRLRAEWAFHHLAPEKALPLILELDPEIWGMWREFAAGELELRQGKTENAIKRLAALWKDFPHHPGLALKLHDLVHPLPQPKIDSGGVCILLYSWNKSDLLEKTIESLAHSDYGKARILVLDNGSSDGTAKMLDKMAALFPEDIFQTISLPVNIGAPGARNWLLSRPEAQDRKWAAFLDDDVILPKDWLSRLLSAASAFPKIGAVGCRIISADTPPSLQSADYNLLPPRGGVKTFQDFEENILVFDNCAGSLDMGLFTYRRPAMSVSGCCHLLNMKSVREAGGFDIRFSPTQFDDLERDMRSALSGYATVYAGDLAIRHVQHSSLAKATSAKAMAQVFGNKIKLEGKYDREQIQALSRNGLDVLWKDFRTKFDRLLKILALENA